MTPYSFEKTLCMKAKLRKAVWIHFPSFFQSQAPSVVSENAATMF